jgi:hypothetical protein
MNAIASRRCNRIAATLFSLTLFTIAVSSHAQPAPAPAANVSPPIPATSAVLIVDSPEGVPDSEIQLQRRVNIHIATLRSEKNIRTMISSANSETRKTSWFTSANDPHERTIWLRDHLHVKQVEGTPLIEVSLPDIANPSDRRTILRDICDTYLETASKQRADALGDRTYALNTVKLKIELRLKQITDDMRQKQINLNADGGGIGRMGVKDMELSKLVDQMINAQAQSDKATASYTALSRAVQSGQNPPGLDTILAGNARIQELQRHLDDAELRLEIARSKSGEKAGGAADPLDKGSTAKPASAKDSAVAELLVETAYLRKKLDLLTSEATAKAKVQLLEEVEQRAQESKNTLNALRERVASLKDEIGDLNNSLVLYMTLQEEQTGLREQLRSVRQQIEQIMALQGRNSSIGIHWHIEPEAEAAN